MEREICTRSTDVFRPTFCKCCECGVIWAAAVHYTYGNTEPIITKLMKRVELRGYPLDDKAQKLLKSVQDGTAPQEFSHLGIDILPRQ